MDKSPISAMYEDIMMTLTQTFQHAFTAIGPMSALVL
jgi:hypothetical protein